MTMKIVWGDEFERFDPISGKSLDGEEQAARSDAVSAVSGRNGYASFQVLAGPVSAGDTVSVVPGALKGPGKARLSPDDFDVYVEWYHRLEDRWYPDALVPQAVVGGSTPDFRKSIGLKQDAMWVAFWVDLFVPAGTKPGCYEGAITVHAGSEQQTLPVSLEVLTARIPNETCLDMSLNNYVDIISAGWADLNRKPGCLLTAKYRRVEQGVFRTAHEHRGFLHYMPYGHSGYMHRPFVPPLAGEGPNRHVTSWKEWDRHFGPYFDGSAFKGTRRGALPIRRFFLPLNLAWPADFVKFGWPGYEAEWRAVGNDMVEHFKEKQWKDTHFDLFLNHKQRFRFFPWDCEEVKYLPDNDLQRYFYALWEGTFDRKTTRPVKFDYTLGTTWVYDDDIYSDISEFVDVFIAGEGGPASHPKRQAELVKEGRAIWSCTTSGGITDSPRAAAYTPLLMYMRNLQGFMPKWASLSGWGGDVWHQPPDAGRTTFMYPGDPFGTEDTYPSMRLKALRNSQQMIDAFETAGKKLGRAKVQARVNRLLGMKRGAWFRSQQGRKAADWGSEEKPVTGWKDIQADTWRTLRHTALELAGK